MLDLQSLADERAHQLSQNRDAWQVVLWSAEFQKISTNMSDGEVEQMVRWCPSEKHLSALVQFVAKNGTGAHTPFSTIQREAEKKGISPADWVAQILVISL